MNVWICVDILSASPKLLHQSDIIGVEMGMTSIGTAGNCCRRIFSSDHVVRKEILFARNSRSREQKLFINKFIRVYSMNSTTYR